MIRCVLKVGHEKPHVYRPSESTPILTPDMCRALAPEFKVGPFVDLINEPPHYTAGRFECIDVIEDQGHGRGFCYGNAIKYLIRAPHKGSELADLKKASWYVARLIKQCEEA